MMRHALALDWNVPHNRITVEAAKGLCAAGYEVRSVNRERMDPQEVSDWIIKNRPERFVCLQRLSGRSEQLSWPLERAGTKRLHLDFGIRDGREHYRYLIGDGAGENATASVVGAFEAIEREGVYADQIEGFLPEVAEWRESVLARADCDGPTEERGFVLHLCQMRRDNVIRMDNKFNDLSPEELADKIIEAAYKAHRFVVVKPHPGDEHWIWRRAKVGKYHIVLDRNMPNNNALNAWLMVHCDRVILVNSTMVFIALLLGKAIAQMGRGWCSGNNLVGEVNSLDQLQAVLTITPPTVNQVRRDRFLALLLSRHIAQADLTDSEKIERLFAVTHRLPEPKWKVITPVSVRGEFLTRKVMQSLAVSDMRKRVFVVDAMTPEFEAAIPEGAAVTVLPPSEGHRLNSIYRDAVAALEPEDKAVWMIEQDAELTPVARARAEAMMEQLPGEVAAIYCETVNVKGERDQYALSDWKSRATPNKICGLPEIGHANFSVCLWRTAALRSVAWNACPTYAGVDKEAWKQLERRGYKAVAYPGCRVVHHAGSWSRHAHKRVQDVRTDIRLRVAIMLRRLCVPSGAARRFRALANGLADRFKVAAFCDDTEHDALGGWNIPIMPNSKIKEFAPDVSIGGWFGAARCLDVRLPLYLLISKAHKEDAMDARNHGAVVLAVAPHTQEALPFPAVCIPGGVALEEFPFADMGNRAGLLLRDRTYLVSPWAKHEIPDPLPLEREMRAAFAGRDVEMNTADFFIKRGRIAGSEMSAAYRVARLFVLCEADCAGWSNTVAEAMASGCPVIANRVGANMDLIEHGKTGWLVKDAKEAAVLAARLYDDEETLANVAANAREEILKYDYKEWVRRVGDLIIDRFE